MFSKLLKLSKKFEKIIQKESSVDALELYPGENVSLKIKFEAVKSAIIDDLNNISSTYHMYDSQFEQSKKQMTHQIHLLNFAKKLQQYISDAIKNGDNFDLDNLQNKISLLEKEAQNLGKSLGLKINLSELLSLRLLKAYFQDELFKKYPKLDTTNWSELSRKQLKIKPWNDLETTKIDDIPETLRSPGVPPKKLDS